MFSLLGVVQTNLVCQTSVTVLEPTYCCSPIAEESGEAGEGGEGGRKCVERGVCKRNLLNKSQD